MQKLIIACLLASLSDPSLASAEIVELECVEVTDQDPRRETVLLDMSQQSARGFIESDNFEPAALWSDEYVVWHSLHLATLESGEHFVGSNTYFLDRVSGYLANTFVSVFSFESMGDDTAFRHNSPMPVFRCQSLS